MIGLAGARAHLESALSEIGIPVYGYVPERAVPPIAVVVPFTPYVTGGDTFGSWQANFAVLIFVKPTTNANTTTEMDAHITSVLDALDESEAFDIEVTQPGSEDINGNQVFSVGISLSLNFTS